MARRSSAAPVSKGTPEKPRRSSRAASLSLEDSPYKSLVPVVTNEKRAGGRPIAQSATLTTNGNDQNRVEVNYDGDVHPGFFMNGKVRKRPPPSSSEGRVKKAPRTRVPIAKVKPSRVPIAGLNARPRLGDSFPAYSSFDFEIPALAPGSEKPHTAFVFGNGDFGQHGLGVDDTVLCEIKRPRLHKWFEEKISKDRAWAEGIKDLECGGMHTLAIDGEGKVWSWGINDNAALGRKTDVPDIESEVLETQPMLVEGLQAEDFRCVQVAAGDSVSLAVSDQGELRCWGSFRASEGLLGFDGTGGSSPTQLMPVPLRNLDAHTIVQVATGDDHFLALTSTGHVFACGNGEQNQLGRKIIQRHKTHGLTPERLHLKQIVLIGSGSYHSFAVNVAGVVFAWGLNSFRQTGVSEAQGGWADTILTPTPVDALHPSRHGGARVVQISGGVHHSLFLFSNGEVWACGRCDGHEVGLPEDHPEMKASEEREKAALKLRAARRQEEHDRLEAEVSSDGAKLSGEEAAFKAAEAAAQGVPLPNPYIPLPSQLAFPSEPESPTRIVQIAAGTRHNFAVSSSGVLYSWGVGNTSQLGLGDEEEAEVPEQVKSQAMGGFRVLKAATGGQHSIVVAVRGEQAKPSIHSTPPSDPAGEKASEVNGKLKSSS